MNELFVAANWHWQQYFILIANAIAIAIGFGNITAYTIASIIIHPAQNSEYTTKIWKSVGSILGVVLNFYIMYTGGFYR